MSKSKDSGDENSNPNTDEESSASYFLPIADRYAVIAFDKYLHFKQDKIAKILQCSRKTVYTTLKRWRDKNTVEDRPRTGRPPLVDVTNAEDNPITNSIRKLRKSTSKILAAEIEESYGVSLSYRTIRRIREQLGFRPVHYRKRPVLTEEHKRKRLQYALDNIDEEWTEIIFTDESWFEYSDGHVELWKRPTTPSIEKPTAKYAFKVMVWGGVWWEGRTKLCFIDGTVDATYYQHIIEDYLIKPHLTEELMVLQDGARAHTAKSTLEYADENDVTLLQNPPNSPELNPIEKVWGWMKHEIEKLNPQSKEEYITIVQEVWDGIPQTVIQGYIRHNKTVVNELIESGGGTIKN